ncbi:MULTISPECIES: YkvA family protein [Dyadobacter]|jgi:uncharacterized membrane protein YkvA (DUF1232 family)|uniref:DUF1232 domain-containing protein n=1 Tax=Dyadobacter psychrotolerans TaxID=2541721 RepID=A0A4R5DQI1_9BACT|nr:YkvA family protein [Dyadobacter psychrotolerans]TDE13265.1 DUF1232 domain-containing protein [Dyadobacter psychrotolerans]
MSLLKNLKTRAKQLKNESFTLYYAYLDPRTPWQAKCLIAVTIGYLFSPIDLIPDFIPILGILDDLILVPLLIRWSISIIPPEILIESRLKADLRASQQTPTSWWFAMMIILIWLIAAYGLYHLLYPYLKFHWNSVINKHS